MKITNTIHQLKIPFQIPVLPEKTIDRFVYMYLIEGESLYLIDAGVKGAEKILFQYLETIERKPEEIAAVFLTHAHPDHIGALKTIKEISDCDVYIHQNEKHWVEDIQKQFEERPIPGFFNLVEGSVSVDHVLNGNESIQPEQNISLKVINATGHSSGSVSYFFEQEKALFSGDAVILPGELPIYTHVEDYINSIEKIKSISNLALLLSAWDDVTPDNEINSKLDASLQYIIKIGEIAKQEFMEANDAGTMEFCKRVLKQLNMPEFIANPLLLKSFKSHL